MIEVFLIRHGETDWNVEGRLQGIEDIPMNKNGIEQAESLAESVHKFRADLIISSPLQRAFQTASLLNEKLQFPRIILNDEIRERNYGQASGITSDEKHRRFPDGDIPGLEPITSLRERVGHFLESLVLNHPGKKIIVVSHGGVINCALFLLSGGNIGTGKTTLRNCCISKAVYENDLWSVEYYNKLSGELNS